MERVKNIRLRHCNGVDLTRTFSAHLCGGGRGFGNDTNALESYSNELAPCIKTLIGFTLIVEVYEEDSSESRRP